MKKHANYFNYQIQANEAMCIAYKCDHTKKRTEKSYYVAWSCVQREKIEEDLKLNKIKKKQKNFLHHWALPYPNV